MKEWTNSINSSSSFEPAFIGGPFSFAFPVPRIASAIPAPVVPRVAIASCDSHEC